MIHEEEFQSPLSTHLFIQSYLRDLSILRSTSKVVTGTGPKHPVWIPPVEGCMKLNVDAALAKSRPGGAVGVICRNGDDMFLGASSLTVQGVTDPSTLEAMECREILALAQDLQLRKITVASDCEAVVNDMSRPCAGIYSTVLEELKATLNLFEVVSFRYENRASNTEAHRLARQASAGDVGRQVWFVNPPDGLCIPNILVNQ
jgi:ribonuclease HI